jgi:hypothetical protein
MARPDQAVQVEGLPAKLLAICLPQPRRPATFGHHTDPPHTRPYPHLLLLIRIISPDFRTIPAPRSPSRTPGRGLHEGLFLKTDYPAVRDRLRREPHFLPRLRLRGRAKAAEQRSNLRGAESVEARIAEVKNQRLISFHLVARFTGSFACRALATIASHGSHLWLLQESRTSSGKRGRPRRLLRATRREGHSRLTSLLATACYYDSTAGFNFRGKAVRRRRGQPARPRTNAPQTPPESLNKRARGTAGLSLTR